MHYHQARIFVMFFLSILCSGLPRRDPSRFQKLESENATLSVSKLVCGAIFLVTPNTETLLLELQTKLSMESLAL